MKHLPKHLQARWRYLAVEIETYPEEPLDRTAVQRAIWNSARALLGDTGSAALDLTVVRFRSVAGTAHVVVRTYRGETERARGAIACITTIGEQTVGLRVRGVSGTIQSCEEKYLGRAPVHGTERTVVFNNEERTAIVRSPRAAVRDGSTFVGATELDFDYE